MSELVLSRQPCPCGSSSDAYATYDDGHGHCFSCGKTYQGDGERPQAAASSPKVKGLIPLGDPVALTKRGLSRETCAKWGYTVSEFKDQKVQVANYRDPVSGQVIAQKVRFPSKDFVFLGDTKAAGLYGQHLWRDTGKRVIITEGEIDALSVSQVLGHKWQVVSLPNGAGGARKALSKHLDWLGGFEAVVLCFDQDDPGRAAVADCVGLFKPGQVKVVRLPLKDPNEMLQAGRVAELVECLWSATEYRPDGIVSISDIRDRVLTEPERGLSWWMKGLDDITWGRRLGEAYALGAGTGVGKTDWITQQIAHDVGTLGQKVGIFAFEQQPAETAKRIAGKLAGKRFHVPDAGWTTPELAEALDQIDGKVFLYDHFGACDWDVVRERITYLVHSEGVRLFYLDHLTALAAAAEDERTALEKIMAEIGGLVKQLDCTILFVSHLATPEGSPHEEGGRVTIRHFKGSRSIGYWSHFMFGLERNQQADEEEERQTTTFRILKDRYTGLGTGKTFDLSYDHNTGRLQEASGSFEDDNEF